VQTLNILLLPVVLVAVMIMVEEAVLVVIALAQKLLS